MYYRDEWSANDLDYLVEFNVKDLMPTHTAEPSDDWSDHLQHLDTREALRQSRIHSNLTRYKQSLAATKNYGVQNKWIISSSLSLPLLLSRRSLSR